MSASYALGCPEVKQYIWVGQGNGGMTTFYTGETDTMLGLTIFLNKYRKHTFRLIYMDDWEEGVDWQDFMELPETIERIAWTKEYPRNRPIYQEMTEYKEGPMDRITEFLKEGQRPTMVMMEALEIHKRDPRSWALPKDHKPDPTYYEREAVLWDIPKLTLEDCQKVQEALDKHRKRLEEECTSDTNPQK